MKKLFPFIIAISVFSGCTSHQQDTDQVTALREKVDSLQARLDNTYAPGLGEFMLGIQSHHTKLWFAGENENWELAKFEITELEENFDDIKTFAADRPEIAHLHLTLQPLKDLHASTESKNKSAFEAAYLLMTNACNSCHEQSQFGFNHIVVPTSNAFPDQDFTPVR